MKRTIAALSVAWLIVAGCGYEPAAVPPAKQVANQQPATNPGPSSSNPGISSPAEGQSGLTGGMRAIGNSVGLAPLDMMSDGPSGGAPARPQQKAPAPKPPGTYEKAQVGVGPQGRDYPAGIITTPVATYFRARERIAFLMVENAMKYFKAEHERLPKDQGEFDKLMSEHGVKLPQLNPGEEYFYDPQKGELFVRHPG